MLNTTLLLQLAVALVPVLGLLVLAVDRMSSKKSIKMRTILKVVGLSILPAFTILGFRGLLDSPVATGFLGIMTGFVLANMVSND